MRTNEVERRFNVSKETLRYYEKEGLVVPKREDNGYRNYSDYDIIALQSILELREIDISIEEIKKIFSGDLLLSDCLKEKQRFIYSKIEDLKQNLTEIEHFVTRKKVDYLYQEQPLSNSFVLFQEQQLTIREQVNHNEYHDITIAYKDIQKCIVSMCSRTYAPTAASYLNGGYLAVLGTVSFGFSFHFYVDLEFWVKNRIYRFESTSLKHMKEILGLLQEQTQSFVDVLKLCQTFNKFNNRIDLELYLEKHFRKWAKEYCLDNPRGNEILETIASMKAKLKKVESLPETTCNPLTDS